MIFQCCEHVRNFNMRVSVQGSEFGVAEFSKEVSIIFFIYEVMTNIIKYAHYKYVEMTVTIENTLDDRAKICIKIGDDGIGLPHAFALLEDTITINNYKELEQLNCENKHIFGIKKLFDIAEELKGKLIIESKRDEGTKLSLFFYEFIES